MINKKKIFILILAFVLNLNNLNVSLAQENSNAKFPDYASEFVGKDKWESFNRKVFTFNLKLNRFIIRPINIVWASVLPQYGIDRVQNFYTNMNYPVRLVGSLLQKDFESSNIETKRFFINTTIGVVGLFDPALSKFNLEPRKEDMEQVLAYHNFKKGPYLVLPGTTQGNVRDIIGQGLDLPLNPTTYVMGPVSAISTGVSYLNNTTSYIQPIAQTLDRTYSDPYEVSKQLWGLDRYIKNQNLDRENVYRQKIAEDKILNIQNRNFLTANTTYIKPDVTLQNFNPQTPAIDSMRTLFFDSKKIDKSIWAELSVWNKTFNKKLKTASVKIAENKPEYKYRYVLQKDKTSPVAIIYPSIGENIMSSQSTVLSKILYDQGYSVIVQGSSFQWEFVQSMPDNYKPGMPFEDAYCSRVVTSKILNSIQRKNKVIFDKKILVGCSFGALNTLFAAAQEEKDNRLGISNYIAINPPIEIMYALKQLDTYCQSWKNIPKDIKLSAALTTQKVFKISQEIANNKDGEIEETLPFTDDEAKLAMSFVMKQKLSDVIFTIEKQSKNEPLEESFYEQINDTSFYDYAQNYLIQGQTKSFDSLNYDSSLYSIANYLNKNNNYKIYHTLDDCFVNKDQLKWLKKQTGNKTILFSNGSHLGFLYRKEFYETFINDTKIKQDKQPVEL